MFYSNDYAANQPSNVVSALDEKRSNKLFFCNAHSCMGDSLATYVRACTHEDAAERMVEFWRTQDVIEDPDDIYEDILLVYEVPSSEGDTGVLNWDDFDSLIMPKNELFGF